MLCPEFCTFKCTEGTLRQWKSANLQAMHIAQFKMSISLPSKTSLGQLESFQIFKPKRCNGKTMFYAHSLENKKAILHVCDTSMLSFKFFAWISLKGRNGILRDPGGKMNHNKNRRPKISCQTPFNEATERRKSGTRCSLLPIYERFD
jgi:hypothetical protein